MEQQISDFKLIAGVGKFDEHKACILSAAVALSRLQNNEPLGDATDSLDCCCPIIRKYAIEINDAPWWSSDEERTEILSRFIPLLLNTKNTKKQSKRAFICGDRAIHIFAPYWLDISKQHDLAKELRELPAIFDVNTARQAKSAADECRKKATAYTAAYAAYAASSAADTAAYAAAYAASSAADTAAYAAAYAAAAAYTAAYDDAAYDDAAYDDVAADAYTTASAAYTAAYTADTAASAASAADALTANRREIRAEAIKLLTDLIELGE